MPDAARHIAPGGPGPDAEGGRGASPSAPRPAAVDLAAEREARRRAKAAERQARYRAKQKGAEPQPLAQQGLKETGGDDPQESGEPSASALKRTEDGLADLLELLTEGVHLATLEDADPHFGEARARKSARAMAPKLHPYLKDSDWGEIFAWALCVGVPLKHGADWRREVLTAREKRNTVTDATVTPSPEPAK